MLPLDGVVLVTCPDGCGPNDLLSVSHPSDGSAVEVVVPQIVSSGVNFEVQLPSGSPSAVVLPASHLPRPPPTTATIVPPDSSDEAISRAEHTCKLTAGQAETLRTIQLALHDYDELGWFIERNCREFREYDSNGEQRLEWSTLHQEYTRLVERRIEQQLSYIGADGDDLYELLEDVVGADARADSFLNKLLSMSDYATFCDMMRWLGRIERRKHTTRL